MTATLAPSYALDPLRTARHKQARAARECADWEQALVIQEKAERGRTPHTCRHSFATRWRRRGLDLDELQIVLGHSSSQTTSDLYVHTNVHDVARRMAEIEARV